MQLWDRPCRKAAHVTKICRQTSRERRNWNLTSPVPSRRLSLSPPERSQHATTPARLCAQASVRMQSQGEHAPGKGVRRPAVFLALCRSESGWRCCWLFVWTHPSHLSPCQPPRNTH